MKNFYTCEEVAKIYKVKIATVWNWVRSKKLKAVKLDKVYRITDEALTEFEQRLS